MSETRSALIVDDEHDIRELLVLTLGRMGLRTDTAPTLTAAREMLSTVSYDLCLTDMRLPDGSGLELISDISTRFPNTPVAMITAFGNVEAAVEALKAGAFDFVSKPLDINVLRGLVRQALELNTKRQAQPDEASRLLGNSDAMVSLRQTRAARRPCTSAANRAPARNSSPAPSMRRARAPAARSCRSTAAPFRRS